MRALQKGIEQPEFVEDAQGGRMHGVAAKIAQEVGMLLQHGDAQSCPGEQQAGHHARGSAADDQDVIFVILHG